MSFMLRTNHLLINIGKNLVKKNQIKKFSVLSAVRLSQLKFTTQHEWIKIDGKIGTVGITDYAQDKLGEVVYLELPEVGAQIEQSNQFATLESVKAVSDCYIPASGKIVEVNEALKENPSQINKSPLQDGWLAKVELSNPSELDKLMDKKQYDEFLKSDQH